MRQPSYNDHFPLGEFETRLARIRAEMSASGVDALLLSTEANVRYFTGLLSGYWGITLHDDVQLALISCNPHAEPVLLLPNHLQATAETTGCVTELRLWSQFSGGKSKQPVDVVADTFTDLKLARGRVGIETGRDDRPGMSIPFLQAMQSRLPEVEWVDCAQALARLRMVDDAAAQGRAPNQPGRRDPGTRSCRFRRPTRRSSQPDCQVRAPGAPLTAAPPIRPRGGPRPRRSAPTGLD